MEKKREEKISAWFGFVLISVAVFPLLLSIPDAGAFSVESMAGDIAFSKKVKSLKDLKFKDMVRQTRDYSCGAAALATMLTYYLGRETTEEEVITHILNNSKTETLEEVKKRGFSLLDLKNYADAVGYKSAGFKVQSHLLKNLDRPALVLINLESYSHFVVVKGIAGKDVFLADPARGNLVLDFDEFLKVWNGILLVFKNPNGSKAPKTFYAKPGDLHKTGIMESQVNLGFVIRPSEFKY